jgi:hypothetical protein
MGITRLRYRDEKAKSAVAVTENSAAADAPEDEIEITPEMIRAGVATYLNWNPDEEEIELLVGVMYLNMRDLAPS